MPKFIRSSSRQATVKRPNDGRAQLLDWVERQALDNIRARFATADLIAKEAQTTLTVLLAGVGATAAYAAKMFDAGPPPPLVLASAATCGYLSALSAILVIVCMRLQSYPSQYQEPRNLMVDLPLEKIRELELINLDDRIKEATLLNSRRARYLNNVRLLAVFSIVVFIAVGVLAPRHQAPSGPGVSIQCAPSTVPATEGSYSCKLGN